MISQVDADFLERFSDRWLNAWNSHSTDRVLELLAEEVVWEDLTFWPEVIEGRENVRAYVDRLWKAMPDVSFDETCRFFAPAGRSGIVLFRQRGSAPRQFSEHPGFDAHGCDIFLAFDGDQLSRYLASYDITEMMRQMQLLPAREGKVGGAYHLSLLGATSQVDSLVTP